MDRLGATLMVLWLTRCDAALASGKKPYMRSGFCRKYMSSMRMRQVSSVAWLSQANLFDFFDDVIPIRLYAG